MQLDRRFHPEAAVSKAPARPGLHHPRLHITRRMLEATDGSLAIRVPVEIEEGDTEGVVPVDALNLARALGDKKEPIRLDCNGAVDVPGVASFERNTQLEFPDIQSAFEGLPDRPKFTFAVSADLLHQAAKALGTPYVTLELFGDGKGIRVTPLHGFGGSAIVMPVKVAA